MLNADKTEYVIFKHPTKSIVDADIKLSIGGKRIHPSSTIKYLGVYIDSNLGWKSQIDDVAIKLKRANGALSKIRHYVPQNILPQVYYALFHSHLNYCSQVWGQQTSLAINRISVLQNNALRLISFANPRTSASSLFKNLGVLRFKELITVLNTCFVRDLYHGALPEPLITTYGIDFSHRFNTRANTRGLINSRSVRTSTFGLKSIRHQSIISWHLSQSALPHIKLRDLTRSQLKLALKRHFIDTY